MNRLVIAPSILAADFGRLLARRAQSLYCAIPATSPPTPSTEACLRKRRNKAIAPYGPSLSIIVPLSSQSMWCRHDLDNCKCPYAAVCFLGFGGLVWLCLLARLSP